MNTVHIQSLFYALVGLWKSGRKSKLYFHKKDFNKRKKKKNPKGVKFMRESKLISGVHREGALKRKGIKKKRLGVFAC